MICLLTVCGCAALILIAAIAANPLPPDIPFLDFSAFPLPVAPSPTDDSFAFTNFELESPMTLMAAAEPSEQQLPCSSGGNTGSGNKQQRRRAADGDGEGAVCPTKDSRPGQIMHTTTENDEIPDLVPQFGQMVDGVPVLFDQYKSKKCPNPKYPLHLCCDGPLGPYMNIYLHWLEVENCVESEFLTHSIYSI